MAGLSCRIRALLPTALSFCLLGVSRFLNPLPCHGQVTAEDIPSIRLTIGFYTNLAAEDVLPHIKLRVENTAGEPVNVDDLRGCFLGTIRVRCAHYDLRLMQRETAWVLRNMTSLPRVTTLEPGEYVLYTINPVLLTCEDPVLILQKKSWRALLKAGDEIDIWAEFLHEDVASNKIRYTVPQSKVDMSAPQIESAPPADPASVPELPTSNRNGPQEP